MLGLHSTFHIPCTAFDNLGEIEPGDNADQACWLCGCRALIDALGFRVSQAGGRRMLGMLL